MSAPIRKRSQHRQDEEFISTFVLLRQHGRRSRRVLVRFTDFPRVGTGFRLDDLDWVVREVDSDLGFVAEPRH